MVRGPYKHKHTKKKIKLKVREKRIICCQIEVVVFTCKLIMCMIISIMHSTMRSSYLCHIVGDSVGVFRNNIICLLLAFAIIDDFI